MSYPESILYLELMSRWAIFADDEKPRDWVRLRWMFLWRLCTTFLIISNISTKKNERLRILGFSDGDKHHQWNPTSLDSS